jgi:hypothetical protein
VGGRPLLPVDGTRPRRPADAHTPVTRSPVFGLRRRASTTRSLTRRPSRPARRVATYAEPSQPARHRPAEERLSISPQQFLRLAVSPAAQPRTPSPARPRCSHLPEPSARAAPARSSAASGLMPSGCTEAAGGHDHRAKLEEGDILTPSAATRRSPAKRPVP